MDDRGYALSTLLQSLTPRQRRKLIIKAYWILYVKPNLVYLAVLTGMLITRLILGFDGPRLLIRTNLTMAAISISIGFAIIVVAIRTGRKLRFDPVGEWGYLLTVIMIGAITQTVTNSGLKAVIQISLIAFVWLTLYSINAYSRYSQKIIDEKF